MARAIASIRRERALFMMRRPRSVAEINVDLALSGWGFRWRRPVCTVRPLFASWSVPRPLDPRQSAEHHWSAKDEDG